MGPRNRRVSLFNPAFTLFFPCFSALLIMYLMRACMHVCAVTLLFPLALLHLLPSTTASPVKVRFHSTYVLVFSYSLCILYFICCLRFC